MDTNETHILEDDRLKEIRADLSKVRFTSTPSWAVKSLFTAVFRMLDILELILTQQAEINDRLRALESLLSNPRIDWRRLTLNYTEKERSQPQLLDMAGHRTEARNLGDYGQE